MGTGVCAARTADAGKVVVVDASFCPGDSNLSPRAAGVPAGTLAAVADDTHDDDGEPVVTRAYAHWHDPQTVTIHPFKDTPLGDAA